MAFPNEETLKLSAEKVLAQMNAEEFDTVAAEVTESAKSALSVAVLKEAWEQVSTKLGEFDKVSATQIVPKDNTATVIVIGDYSNGKIQLTVAYNTDMEIIEFWLK